MNEDPNTQPTAPIPPEDEAPKAGASPPTGDPPPVKRFTRSASDKLIGGVSGGLGRYFGVDPILFRIAFVVLTFAGGVGVLAYIGLLAFVPADDDSRVFGASRAANVTGAIVLGVAAVLVLGGPAFFLGPVLVPAAILVGLGLVLWRAAGGRPPSGDVAQLIARGALLLLIGIAAVGGFAGVFLLAALGGGTTLAVLAIVAGMAMVVAAFAGGARWLIVPALVLVLPLAIVAAADLNIEGGAGERTYRPASAAELQPEYRLGMGELVVDLRDVELPAGRTEMRVEVGMGHTIVRVPEDACVSSDVEIGAGYADVFDGGNGGVDFAVARSAAPAGGVPQLHLDADIGLGALEVRRGDEPIHGARWNDDVSIERAACP